MNTRTAAQAPNSVMDPIFYGREGVEETWTAIHASMTQPGFVSTIEDAKKVMRSSAFWTLSPLYIGKKDVNGNIQIVSILRNRENKNWVSGERAYEFEHEGRL